MHGREVERWAAARHLYLDNLKVILIAAIIAAHAITSYATEAWWLYSDVRETTLSSATETVLLAVAGPFGLIMIPLLFLVAGLLTPPSLDRKGTQGYVQDRMLRLGVPFAAAARRGTALILATGAVAGSFALALGAHPPDAGSSEGALSRPAGAPVPYSCELHNSTPGSSSSICPGAWPPGVPRGLQRCLRRAVCRGRAREKEPAAGLPRLRTSNVRF